MFFFGGADQWPRNETPTRDGGPVKSLESLHRTASRAECMVRGAARWGRTSPFEPGRVHDLERTMEAVASDVDRVAVAQVHPLIAWFRSRSGALRRLPGLDGVPDPLPPPDRVGGRSPWGWRGRCACTASCAPLARRWSDWIRSIQDQRGRRRDARTVCSVLGATPLAK